MMRNKIKYLVTHDGRKEQVQNFSLREETQVKTCISFWESIREKMCIVSSLVLKEKSDISTYIMERQRNITILHSAAHCTSVQHA